MDGSDLEARRLALEERKFDEERRLRDLDVAAKQRESSWIGRLFSPLTTTLMAGILTIAGTATATLLQGRSTLRLEAEKEQHELILKMVAVGDVEQARKNIRFLAETGLITKKELADKILQAKETPVLPRPSGAPAANAVVTMTPDEFSRRVSAEAVNMIISFETGGRTTYESKFSHPSAQGSGITIGFGYDLGLTTEDTFRRDWAPYLTSADLDRLAPMIGVRGDEAKAAVPRLADISIRWEDALAMFNTSLIRWAVLLDGKLPNVRDLPPDCYGALLSLVFNRGAAFEAQGERFTEMRNIQGLMQSKQFDGIPAQIRAMKRLWPSTGLATRREQEAKLCEKGLAPGDALTSR
jgi:hypothetical protein